MAAGIGLYFWSSFNFATRETSLLVARQLSECIESGDLGRAKSLLKLPVSMGGKTSEEQERLMSDVLKAEVSQNGLLAINRHGRFGLLREVFPDEAEAWAKAFSVNADDCVAFSMQRNGLRAELVLWNNNGEFRVLRCNNVRQMAGLGTEAESSS